MQVGDDQAAEVEPEAVALAEGVEFGETLEDIAVLLGRDAAARVGDGDEDAVVAQTVAFEADRAFLREFIGVAEQCRDEYRQVFVAGVERNLRDRDRAFVNDARLGVPHLHDPQLRLAYGAEVRILARQRCVQVFEVGHFEHVVEQESQLAAVVPDDFAVLGARLRGDLLGAEQLGESHDAVERRTHFVADGVDECGLFKLAFVGVLRLQE